MAKLAYTVSQAGLEVPALIGVDGQMTTALVAAGRPVPPPVMVRALLDSGSSVTAIAPWVFQRLNLSSRGRASTLTAAGQVGTNLFHVSLTILPLGQLIGPTFTLPAVWASELSVVLPDADVLIGLNVLLECKLLLDGPARAFFLEF